jgi:hypothetical protein
VFAIDVIISCPNYLDVILKHATALSKLFLGFVKRIDNTGKAFTETQVFDFMRDTDFVCEEKEELEIESKLR